MFGNAALRSAGQSLEYFFAYLMDKRGGICIGGERRPATLHMVEDHEDEATSLAFVRRELLDDNISFLFGLTRSSSLIYMADALNASGVLTLTSTANSYSLISAWPRMFTVFVPLRAELPPMGLVQTVNMKTIAFLADPDTFYTETCALLDGLATPLGMTIVANYTTVITTDADLEESYENGLRYLQSLNADVIVGCVPRCKLMIKTMEKLQFNAKLAHCLHIFDDVDTKMSFEETQALRFFITMSPWGDEYDIPVSKNIFSAHSAYGQLSNKEWAKNFTAATNIVPDYGSAYGWVAGQVFVTAVELANSTDPDAVRSALQKVETGSIVGDIKFDSIGYGRNSSNVLQIQTDFGMQAKKLDVRGSNLYPMPKWPDRPCHIKTERDSNYPSGPFGAYGYTGGACARCNDEQAAEWNQASSRMECKACPAPKVLVPVYGAKPLPAYSCESCALGSNSYGMCQPGTMGASCQCIGCGPGSFSNTSGASLCQACPAGTYADGDSNTECLPCRRGSAASKGSQSCIPCDVGWFVADEGAAECSFCPDGTATMLNINSTSCTACELGRYSSYGQAECLPCPIGTYGAFSTSIRINRCVEGSRGGVFTSAGQKSAGNRDGYWTDYKIVNAVEFWDWKACIGNPGSCLRGHRCAEGSTGLHCTACLPGFASNPRLGIACFQCPEIIPNLAATVLVLALTTLAACYMTVVTGAAAHRKGLDQRLVIFKLCIFHCFALYVLFDDFGVVAALNYDHLEPWLQDLLYGISNVFSILPGFSLLSESIVWSVSCMMQDEDKLGLAEFAKNDTHLMWQMPAHAGFKQNLKDFQMATEKRVIIFWMCWPILVAVFTYLALLLNVTLNVMIHRRWYVEADEFTEHIMKDGTHEVSLPLKDCIECTMVSRHRILNLWYPKWFVTRTGFRNPWRCWVNFNHGVRPMLMAVSLITYGGVLVNLTRSLVCRDLGRFSVLSSLSTVDCDETNEFQQIAEYCFWGYGIGLPVGMGVVTSWKVWRHIKENFDDDPGWCSAVSLGYRRSSHHWDIWVLFVKLALLQVHMLNDLRLSGQLFVLILFGIFHEVYKPYKSTVNSLAPRLGIHLNIVLVASSLVFSTRTLQDLLSIFGQANDSETGAPETLSSRELFILFIIPVILNLSIMIRSFRHVISETIDAMVSGMYKGLEFTPTRTSPFQRLALVIHRRQHRRLPFLSFEPKTGWVTVMSSRSDIGQAVRHMEASVFEQLISHSKEKKTTGPGQDDEESDENVVFHPSELEDDLNKDARETFYTLGGVRIRRGTVLQRCVVQESILHAARHASTLPGSPAFSISILEFVVRACFVLAREIEEEEHVVDRCVHTDGGVDLSREDSVAPAELPRAASHRQAEQTFASEGHARRNSSVATAQEAAPTWGTPSTTLGHLFQNLGGHVQAKNLSRQKKGFLIKVHQREFRHLRKTNGGWSSCHQHIAPHKASIFWTEFLAAQKVLCPRRKKQVDKGPTRTTFFDSFRGTGNGVDIWAKVDDHGALKAHVEDRLQTMFDDSTYEMGVELAFFEEAVLRLETLAESELRLWMDMFEVRWNQANRIALWAVKSYTSRLQGTSTWCIENEEHLPEDPEELERERQRQNWGNQVEEEEESSDAGEQDFSGAPKKKKKTKATTRASLSWARLAVLSQFGFPGGSSASHRPTLGEGARLLRQREEHRSLKMREAVEDAKNVWQKTTEERKRMEAQLAMLKTALGGYTLPSAPPALVANDD